MKIDLQCSKQHTVSVLFNKSVISVESSFTRREGYTLPAELVPL